MQNEFRPFFDLTLSGSSEISDSSPYTSSKEEEVSSSDEEGRLAVGVFGGEDEDAGNETDDSIARGNAFVSFRDARSLIPDHINHILSDRAGCAVVALAESGDCNTSEEDD